MFDVTNPPKVLASIAGIPKAYQNMWAISDSDGLYHLVPECAADLARIREQIEQREAAHRTEVQELTAKADSVARRSDTAIINAELAAHLLACSCRPEYVEGARALLLDKFKWTVKNDVAVCVTPNGNASARSIVGAFMAGDGQAYRVPRKSDKPTKRGQAVDIVRGILAR